jgi:DNA replication protein DnaC
MLDRLLHHCEVIAINGPSYRLKNRLSAVGTTVKTATA